MRRSANPPSVLKDNIENLRLGTRQGPTGIAARVFEGKEAYGTVRPVIAGIEPTVYRDTRLPLDQQWSFSLSILFRFRKCNSDCQVQDGCRYSSSDEAIEGLKGYLRSLLLVEEQTDLGDQPHGPVPR